MQFTSAYRLLPEPQLLRLAGRMPAALLMTPAKNLITVDVASPPAQIVFPPSIDQLPVVRAGQVVGMIFCGRNGPRSFHPSVLEDLTPLQALRFPARKGIGDLLEVIASVPGGSLLAVDRQGGVLGLIHVSDLNRQACKAFLFVQLTAVEMVLSSSLRALGQEKAWLAALPEADRARIREARVNARRARVELEPLDAAGLTPLLKGMAKLPVVLAALGLTKKEFQAATGRLVGVRNAVMHPVNSLVREPADAMSLRRSLEAAQDLIRRAGALLPEAAAAPAAVQTDAAAPPPSGRGPFG